MKSHRVAGIVMALVAAGALPLPGCKSKERRAEEAMREVVLIATARDVHFHASYRASNTIYPVDPTCPVVTIMGSTMLLEGGCTDSDGATWAGSAVVEGDVSGDYTITWDGYSVTDSETCAGAVVERLATADGTVAFSGVGTALETFDVDLTVINTSSNFLSCDTTAHERSWNYAGTRAPGPDTDGDTIPDGEVFEGAGTAIVGDDGDGYLVDVETVDQYVDREVCNQEPLSGTTTLTDGTYDAIVVNDGATDCDDPPMGQFTFAGEDLGETEIGGVCSVVRIGAASRVPVGPAAVLLAALLAGLRFRRRP